MPTYTKNVYQRQADWPQLYQDLLTESKTSGYTELNNFLNKWCNGVQKSTHSGLDNYWLDLEKFSKKELAYTRKHAYKKHIIPLEERKVIQKQARSLGVRVPGPAYGSVMMSLKDYKK
jgi:hypothetical protein